MTQKWPWNLNREFLKDKKKKKKVKIKDEKNLELQKSRCVLLNAIMFLIHSGLNLLDIEPYEKI